MYPQELGHTDFVELRGPRFVGLMIKNPATGSVKPGVDVRVVLLVDLWGSEPLQNFTGLSSTVFCCGVLEGINKTTLCGTAYLLSSSPHHLLVAILWAG